MKKTIKWIYDPQYVKITHEDFQLFLREEALKAKKHREASKRYRAKQEKKMFGNAKTQSAPDFEYFVYFDSKVGIYEMPMLAINRHDLLREVERMFRDPKQQQNKLLTNAEDFAIFKIGAYSKTTGIITPCQHEHIVNLHEIRSIVMRTIPLRNDAQPSKPQTEMGII